MGAQLGGGASPSEVEMGWMPLSPDGIAMCHACGVNGTVTATWCGRQGSVRKIVLEPGLAGS